MKRRGLWVALLCAAAVMLSVAVAAFFHLRDAPVTCQITHVRFDPTRPELMAGRVSSNQRAELTANGAPQAFTIYLDCAVDLEWHSGIATIKEQGWLGGGGDQGQ